MKKIEESGVDIDDDSVNFWFLFISYFNILR